MPKSRIRILVFLLTITLVFVSTAAAQVKPVAHGLWVWKGPTVVATEQGAKSLRDFCVAQSINEVYISVSAQGAPEANAHLARAIAELHRAHIRVEALLSSEEADEPGKHRDKLLDHVREIVAFNAQHPAARFDGVHLDIEPQQRPENKGPGNLRFVPGLVDAYRAVLAVAQPANLTVNADIQNKLLKGDRAEREMLLTALPHFTLMLYEVSSPTDGESLEQQKQKIVDASEKFFAMAYDGLMGEHLATLTIGLRTPDYGEHLPEMLQAVDAANRANPHYAGWPRHSYNDTLKNSQ
jgi:hypothetical protein